MIHIEWAKRNLISIICNGACARIFTFEHTQHVIKNAIRHKLMVTGKMKKKKKIDGLCHRDSPLWK